MTPLADLPRVGPNDELLTAVQLMDANQLLQLPVFDGSQLSRVADPRRGDSSSAAAL